MKNQEYLLYAHHMGDIDTNDNLIGASTEEMEFVNINGQLVPILTETK